jgi:hypothetical protein
VIWDESKLADYQAQATIHRTGSVPTLHKIYKTDVPVSSELDNNLFGSLDPGLTSVIGKVSRRVFRLYMIYLIYVHFRVTMRLV